MSLPRIIPVLLLRSDGLVKTVKFKDHKYIGDPMNAVKIFNEKEVDELIFLDIDASKENREPPYELLREISSECFMPLAYGGGVNKIEQISKLIQSGIEKIVINSAALLNHEFLRQATQTFGSSSIVAAMDIKKSLLGRYHVYSHVERKVKSLDPVEYAKKLRDLGAGELFLNNVDLDGTMRGYDFDYVKRITEVVDIPVIACGGASSLEDLAKVIKESHAAAAAAGSFFVFYGKHKAVLITYPSNVSIERING